mmetsp:Transcript_65353/g.98578  ORF Transcript_65353/g.98578 Transcript_65353/m.98578 type:complete len:104 (-) Transcript_65353:52-363(-)
MSPLVNALVNGDREGVGGFLCNDPSGLCLVSKGNMSCGNESGVYTSLVRLASQLSPNQQAHAANAPLVTIETDNSSILIKEYDGHTVAFTVPNSTVSREQTIE